MALVYPFHFRTGVQDTKGNARPNWQAECVVRDTTTVVPIYADENSTPIASVSGVANRALADSNGNLSFFVESGAYDVRYYDEAGAYQITERYISMVSGVSAGSVGFAQADAAAVQRDLLARGRETVRLLDYVPVAKHAGILAGTNTDDLAAYFQAALDTGLLVRLPETGMGWIGSKLYIPSHGGMVGNFGFTIKAKPDFDLYAMIRNKTLDPATNAARDQGIVIAGVKIDGNKSANTLTTEQCHCLCLRAVDGAHLDVWTVNPKGDGVTLMYAYPVTENAGAHLGIGCNNIRGFIRSEGAARQGVSLVSIENFDLSVYATGAALIGLDIETDNSANFVRHGVIRLQADNCGGATGTAGGFAISGSASGSAADVRNIIADVAIRDCNGGAFGGGISYRDVKDVVIRGSVTRQTGAAIVGLSGGINPSRVTLDVDVDTPTLAGAVCSGVGDIINGSLRIRSAGDVGAQITSAAGGTLRVRIESAAQQGLYLNNTSNMTFPDAQIINCGSVGVYLAGTSSGNRFPNLRATGSTFGYGVQEAGTASDNRVTNARVTGNAAGTASLLGSTSLVEREDLFGKATYDAPSIAASGSTTTTVTVTGAAVGDEARVTFGVSLGGLIASAYVSAANTVTVVLQNPTGSAIDLASTTIKAFVRPRVTA